MLQIHPSTLPHLHLPSTPRPFRLLLPNRVPFPPKEVQISRPRATPMDGNGAIPAGDLQNVLLPARVKSPRSHPRPRSRGRIFPRPRPRAGIAYPTGPLTPIDPRRFRAQRTEEEGESRAHGGSPSCHLPRRGGGGGSQRRAGKARSGRPSPSPRHG